MQAPTQPVAHWLVRGTLVAAVSFLSVAAWAQGAKPVAPPPADLEPGVNTSATQPSSSDAAPASSAAPMSAPVPAKKSAPTPARPAAGAQATGPATATSGPASSAAPAKSGTASASGATVGTATPTSSSPTAATTARTSTAPKSGAPAGKAHDNIELDTTQITGNRELPKVLYIVPWKRSDLGDLVGKPVNSLLDEVLTPVDRDVFKRQNRYYDALKPDEARDAGGAAAAPTEKR
jgi:hypothetical protein